MYNNGVISGYTHFRGFTTIAPCIDIGSLSRDKTALEPFKTSSCGIQIVNENIPQKNVVRCVDSLSAEKSEKTPLGPVCSSTYVDGIRRESFRTNFPA